MTTIQLKWFAWIFFALILANVTANSGNLTDKKDRNKPIPQYSCISSISGLSDLQKQKITAMETQHFAVMNEFREKIQTSSDKTQKEEIRKQMDKQIVNHQNTIQTVLSADQQKQYILLQTKGDNQNQQAHQQGNKQGHGKGNGNGQGRGRGMGMNNRF
ncbi:MAG: hypothetical protein WAO52_00405 [Prolixibacteraceae bacterium]